MPPGVERCPFPGPNGRYVWDGQKDRLQVHQRRNSLHPTVFSLKTFCFVLPYRHLPYFTGLSFLPLPTYGCLLHLLRFAPYRRLARRTWRGVAARFLHLEHTVLPAFLIRCLRVHWEDGRTTVPAGARRGCLACRKNAAASPCHLSNAVPTTYPCRATAVAADGLCAAYCNDCDSADYLPFTDRQDYLLDSQVRPPHARTVRAPPRRNLALQVTVDVRWYAFFHGLLYRITVLPHVG